MVTSPMACHSTEDLRHQQYDSAESLSSLSSGHSVGAPSFGQISQGIGSTLMRSSQSYPYIPPNESSGRVHDPTPRSSLPMSSLDMVPPSQHLRGMDSSIPATAAVMQCVPFSFRTDAQLIQHNPLRHGGRVEINQDLSSYNRPTESPIASKTTQHKTVTTGISYRVNCSHSTGEQSKPTYLSATHLNMLAPEDGGGRLAPPTHEMSGRSQNRLSDPMLLLFPTVSSHQSASAYTAMYVNPQQAWVSSPQLPTTYVSSLSSSCECLPSVTSGRETAVYPSTSSCKPANNASAVPSCGRSNSPRLNNDSVDHPEYANGMKMLLL